MPILRGQTCNDLRGHSGAAIRIVINLEGEVLSFRIERSSGFRTLDDEALSLLTRAQPLSKP
ncbi:energy transducer TonB [uncultured Roseibium sp.]|uniref:energy transducer TonB family protein n=1 Tax=uncultured Roseibium sp. TaxID=1936171 RepID=UPI002617F90F|nr:energy transducer TonB [uncultured Roseibium sp.]